MNTCPCCGAAIDPAANPQLALETVRLGGKMRAVAEKLAERFGRFVDNDALIWAAYGDDPSGGPLHASKCLHIAVHELRPRLAGVGLGIESGHGRYRMVRLPEEAT